MFCSFNYLSHFWNDHVLFPHQKLTGKQTYRWQRNRQTQRWKNLHQILNILCWISTSSNFSWTSESRNNLICERKVDVYLGRVWKDVYFGKMQHKINQISGILEFASHPIQQKRWPHIGDWERLLSELKNFSDILGSFQENSLVKLKKNFLPLYP